MPGNVDEAKWNEAKAAARKQYPKAKGTKFWKIVQAIYQKMTSGDKVEKSKKDDEHTHSHKHTHRMYMEGHPESYKFEHDHEHTHRHDHFHLDENDHDHDKDDKKEKRLVLKAMPQGGAHPSHRYLRREGTPGNWTYLYDESKGQDDKIVPTHMGMSEGGKKISTAGRENPGASRTGASAGGQSGGGGAPATPAKLTLNASILRDARPEDLQNPQIVLWTATTEQGAESMRATARFVGTHQSGGTQFSATREGALSFVSSTSPVLLAAKLETAQLKPHAPAKTLQESLFPEDLAGSLCLYPNPVSGNAIVGMVRPDDPLWPEGDENGEMSRVSEQTNQSIG